MHFSQMSIDLHYDSYLKLILIPLLQLRRFLRQRHPCVDIVAQVSFFHLLGMESTLED